VSSKPTPREQQVLDALHRVGRATVAEIVAAMPEPTSYAAVRAALRSLAEKELVRHEYDGPRYVYEPTVAKEAARRHALEHIVGTLFDGSVRQAMAALLALPRSGMPAAQRKRLAQMIADAEREGR
jgi:predicted transcriptional regulator